MQGSGIDYMVGHGMTEILDEKEFVMNPCHTYEKVSNLHKKLLSDIISLESGKDMRL